MERKFNRGISGSSGLKICHNISMVKVALTHRTRDRARRSNLKENLSKPHKKKGNGKSKKTLKVCDFHKIPWHNTDECHSKQSLLVELKEKESYLDLEYEFGTR
jgi:hypothetical protein